MKLRLLLWRECNRKCEDCCNQYWDLNALKKTTNFKGYSEILLTGGEPMLKPLTVAKICTEIKRQTDAPIYMYTAKIDCLVSIESLLHGWIDGITLTLHEQKDVQHFAVLNYNLLLKDIRKSFRLNVFKGIDISGIDTRLWKVKDNMVWDKECPLPKDEVLMAYGFDNWLYDSVYLE